MKSPATRRQPAASHVPALDGLRAVAVLLVIVAHVAWLWGPSAGGTAVDRVLFLFALSGWCGVDLFFVLSGYLITGILLDAGPAPGALRAFYGRRALRILPAYLLYVAAVLPLFLVAAFPREAAARWVGAVLGTGWYWTVGVNVLMALRGAAAVAPGAGHLWSLSIEEQFYLAWPWAVRRLTPARLRVACLALLAAAFALRVALRLWTGVDPMAIYVATPTRCDGLAAGAWLAAVARDPDSRAQLAALATRVARWGAWRVVVALALTLAVLTLLGPFGPSPGTQLLGYTIAAVGGIAAVAVAAAAPEGSPVARLLSGRATLWIGRRSYGMYLLQAPVLGLLQRWQFAPDVVPRAWGSSLPGFLAHCAIVVAATAALAWASWRWLEAPALRLKQRFRYPTAAPWGVAALERDRHQRAIVPGDAVRGEASLAADGDRV